MGCSHSIFASSVRRCFGWGIVPFYSFIRLFAAVVNMVVLDLFVGKQFIKCYNAISLCLEVADDCGDGFHSRFVDVVSQDDGIRRGFRHFACRDFLFPVRQSLFSVIYCMPVLKTSRLDKRSQPVHTLYFHAAHTDGFKSVP